MKKNLYLVQFPFSNWGLGLPYSVACLEAYCSTNQLIQEQYQFMPYIYKYDLGLENIVSNLEDPFLVGFSLYMWNTNRSLKLARLVKKKFPHCRILVGGPSLPDDGARFLIDHPYVDFCIHKEGEIPFEKLLVALSEKSDSLEDIPGLSYRKDSRTLKNSALESLKGEINYPSPYGLGLLDSIVKEASSEKYLLSVFETNRGCPYSCTFCDWGSYTQQKIRPFALKRVYEDIEWISRNSGYAYVADANFGVLSRDKEIADFLAKHSMAKNGKSKLHTARVFYAKNSNNNVIEIAKTLDQAKLARSGFSISFQTLTKSVLDNVKRSNISTEKLVELNQKLINERIPTFTELIIGMPGETYESFKASVELVLDYNFSDINFFSLVKIPNAEMFNARDHSTKYTKLILTKGHKEDENEYYDSVVSTPTMDKVQIKRLKNLQQLVEIMHLRKWLFYISTFMMRTKELRRIDFYDQLLSFFGDNSESVIGKIVSRQYLEKFNEGRVDEYVGKNSPGSIDWSGLFFNPNLFHWICIHEEIDAFYAEIADFLSSYNIDDELISDLVKFQRSMMLTNDFDPLIGKTEEFCFDWVGFFSQDKELKKIQNSLSFNTKKVGRQGTAIVPNNPMNLYHIAGGYENSMDKIGCFIHAVDGLTSL